MLLKYFYDQDLAHASYLVGCQRSGDAVVVDPGRDIDQYLAMADKEGVKIVAVAETHIHADYVSGARELADRVGAKLIVSDEGPQQWKYLYLDEYDSHAVHDGDHFMIGNIRFDVMHTPGHTPESISFVLTDQGGGADQPMGIFTGDFVFVGSIGRPDLLEQAAGLQGTAEPGARDLFHSVERFKSLPDYLQVWPAHGAGSACGKGLGAIPSSTVGYEKRFNPALQFNDEDEFVGYILADQPEAPKYFAVMKRVNREGPRILGIDHHHKMLDVTTLVNAIESGTVVDLTPSAQYAKGHVPGTINIPIEMLSTWAGWLVDYNRPAYLICEPQQLQKAARVLHKIGVEEIVGAFDAREVRSCGLATEVYATGTPADLSHSIETGEALLIDVRSDQEWDEGHIEQAEHRFLGRLPENLDQIPMDRKLVVQCRSGARSAIGASVLQAAGFKDVVDLTGGYLRWKKEGLPSVRSNANLRQTEVTHSGL
jgi:hydroxyacylglutathione hydrolase